MGLLASQSPVIVVGDSGIDRDTYVGQVFLQAFHILLINL